MLAVERPLRRLLAALVKTLFRHCGQASLDSTGLVQRPPTLLLPKMNPSQRHCEIIIRIADVTS